MALRNHLAKSNWVHNLLHFQPCPSSTISLKMKVQGSGCRSRQKGSSKRKELTTTRPKAALITLYLLLYFLEEQWQQLMRTSEPQLQWHWRRIVRTQAWKTHLWASTHPQGLEHLGGNQTYSLKGVVLFPFLVSVGRDYLHKEQPKHQIINIFSTLKIMTIHQRIIKDWFTNESDCRPNTIYELGQTWIFHAGQTKRAYDFLSWPFMRSWP